MRWTSNYGRHDTQEWELRGQSTHKGLSLGSVVKDGDGMYTAYNATGDKETFDRLSEAKSWVEAQARED